MNAVGPGVRRLRAARGWSQEELAVKLQVGGWDCSRSWLAKIEARQVLVRDHQLLSLCIALGVKLEALFPTLNPKRAMRPAAATKGP
jgi:transcriptional regulator with XRE-family HTH domain